MVYDQPIGWNHCIDDFILQEHTIMQKIFIWKADDILRKF